ncbi:hypothetical protein D3C78_1502460 [compost metagenome]
MRMAFWKLITDCCPISIGLIAATCGCFDLKVSVLNTNMPMNTTSKRSTKSRIFFIMDYLITELLLLVNVY